MDAAARGANGAPDGPPLVDAGGLVERVIGRYRGLSRERGIELIGSIAIGLPAIETSAEVLERVVGRLFAAVIGAARAGDRPTYGGGSGEGDSVRIFQIGRAHVWTPALMRISYDVFCLNTKILRQG